MLDEITTNIDIHSDFNVMKKLKKDPKGTIEENIIKLQENKDKLIKDFINDDLSNSGLLKSLSDKDIIDLFPYEYIKINSNLGLIKSSQGNHQELIDYFLTLKQNNLN